MKKLLFSLLLLLSTALTIQAQTYEIVGLNINGTSFHEGTEIKSDRFVDGAFSRTSTVSVLLKVTSLGSTTAVRNVVVFNNNVTATGTPYTYTVSANGPFAVGTEFAVTIPGAVDFTTRANSHNSFFVSTVMYFDNGTTTPTPVDEAQNYKIRSTIAPDAPMPVTLTSFAAVRQSAGTLLTWATASEKNNAGFDVQVSENGITFTTVSTVAGAGNSTSVRTYRYTDTRLGLSGALYYRLRQVDTDGTATFSPVAMVSVVGSNDGVTQIYNTSGQLLRTQGANEPLTLPEGKLYIMVTTDKDGHRTVRKAL